MEKRRVALLGDRQLLGESLEHILGNVDDFSLSGFSALDGDALAFLAEQRPDIVLIIESEGRPEYAPEITAQILERFADLPIIRVALDQSVVRFYSSHTLTADSKDLIDLIRSLPVFDKKELFGDIEDLRGAPHTHKTRTGSTEPGKDQQRKRG